MKVIATPIKAADLQPGDLFSNANQQMWDIFATDKLVVGQKVYIRTANKTPKDQADELIYKITIQL